MVQNKVDWELKKKITAVKFFSSTYFYSEDSFLILFFVVAVVSVILFISILYERPVKKHISYC